jgi:phage tail P2-like protein
MFTFDVTKWVPKFILRDKNGYAIAKAIEAAMQIMNDTIAEGVACIADYDTMPEWRLDELAWETNCLYDYNADVETKRQWIKNAIPLYRLYGTPQAVYKYIGSYFDNIDLEEAWEYNGDPYHFRVTVEGEWTPENEAWARRAINTAKNVRSVLDSLRIGCKCFVGITADGRVLGRFRYPMTGPEQWAGRWPQENTIGVIDDTGRAAAQADALPYPFPYPMTGTRPQENTLGAIMDAGAGVDAQAEGYRYAYPMTSGDVNAGTIPQINTLGVLGENDIQAAQADDTYTRIPYKMCGQDEI